MKARPAHRNAMIGALLSTVLVASALSVPASADTTTPTRHGRTVGLNLRNSRIILGGDTGGLGAVPVPVSCWYEPYMGGAEMWQHQNQLYGQGHHHEGNFGGDPDDDSSDQLKRYKKHRTGDGKWWIAAYVDNAAGLSCASALDQFTWVGNQDDPPPQSITGEKLAQVARAAMKIPKIHIKLNPAHTSYVSMPTWVWATGNDPDRPRQVTAHIRGTQMWATVRATPSGLHLSAGTSAATLHPASGNCTGMGKPFPGGNPKQNPPCGVTYHRSSAGQPGRAYTLTANIAWHITWDSYDGGGPPLPDATFGNSVQVPVGEVQSNVNGSH